MVLTLSFAGGASPSYDSPIKTLILAATTELTKHLFSLQSPRLLTMFDLLPLVAIITNDQ